MKFLVNSKYFASKIAQAVGMESTHWHSSGDNLVFTGGFDVVEMDVSQIKEPCTHNDEEFRQAYWRDVLRYLKVLPEQPLTIVMHSDQVEIYCVAVFKTIDQD